MNEYSVSDYGIFSSAINTTNSVKTKSNEFKSSLSEVNTVISNESVFMRPVADECKTTLAGVNTEIDEVVGNFDAINTFLQQTSGNYQDADKKAGDTTQFLKLKGSGGADIDAMNAAASELAERVEYRYVRGGGAGSNPDNYTGGYDCGLFVSAILQESGENPNISLENQQYIQAVGDKTALWHEELLTDNGWSKHSFEDLAQLTAGDILFSGGHVVLYTGDGKITHASSLERGIKIQEEIYDPGKYIYYYHKTSGNMSI